MAVGVPENDVFAAADTVLSRGERPTVERVRLELGRGSPARVGGLLDQWWEGLAQRLRSETRLPALPAEVSQAFVTVWQQAIEHARGEAAQVLAEQREVLEDERARIATVEEEARQETARYRQRAADALATQQAAERRLADLERLLEQRQQQIEDLARQRDGLQADRDQARQQVQTLEQQAQALRDESEHQRKEQQAYVRGIEDRAHREVDRAREESKATTVQLKQLGKHAEGLQQRLEATLTQLSEAQQQAASGHAVAEQSARQVQHLQGQLQTHQSALNEAVQKAVAHEVRAETLEEQVTQLRLLLKPERKRGAQKKAAPKPR